ncbi:uncharacterized protein KY384_003236 [Bacidia gigantensis]|uniref:uncharacterized protein n=1 Tax=Bacidia gigantensis TaxID=2732470 RepID=UPI001D042780|nr:uncharacterized protein KY384_003236 [Bacidia gigantensis]KAG8531606.1 hypothetical protein KY384_003236 [Bacidia gigantensis]
MAQSRPDVSNNVGSSSHVVGQDRDQSPNSLPTSGSASDNESSERVTREKLKKASIGSLGQDSNAGPAAASTTDVPVDVKADPSPTGGKPGPSVDNSRGRSQRKRSFDESEDKNLNREDSKANEEADTNTHARKRSRDVKKAEHVSSEREALASATECTTRASKDGDEGTNHNNATADTVERLGQVAQGIQPATIPEVDSEPSRPFTSGLSNAIQEGQEGTRTPLDPFTIRDGTYSPRKKRSRDQFDAEVNREQKVAATEEARAQRLSSEVDRPAVAALGGETFPPPSTLGKREGDQHDPPKNVFGSISGFASDTTKARMSSPGRSSEPQTASASAFASSGFAALAQSSTSPFGPFAGVTVNGAGNLSGDSGAASKWEKTSVAGSHTKTLMSSAPSQKNDSSPFSGLEPSKPSVFGGSIFGQRFDGGFGAGDKLTTFAAPNGDANLGSSKGAIRPIGSPEHEDEMLTQNHGEGDGDNDTEKGDVTEEEADEQSQDPPVGPGNGEDGEHSEITTKASLFAFRNNVWKESGKGTFKFNVADADNERGSSKTGRFIMRAHQTYRVMLNTPVFKEMKVGDSKGNEPAGKSFAFLVIEDGKPTPHMIKVISTFFYLPLWPY